MPLRVTFDTGALNDVVSPETSQRGASGTTNGTKVRAAIKAGKIQGMFCEVLITLEGITNADRSAVFGSTAVNATYRHKNAPDGSGVTYINSRVEQPGRRPLDRRQADRFLGAFALGMKLLGAPRLGMIRVDDPNGDRYADDPSETDLSNRLDSYYQVTEAIEARGLGCAQAQLIAQGIKARIGGYRSFVECLGYPQDSTEQKKINRAIAEWADGDSVAAHYGYGIDLFCSEDSGKSASSPSVLDPNNRKWLSENFAIRFVTLAELADLVTP